ncbi:MAG TPA: asparagine synthase (glutamine-hydrolyzing) [Rhodospirillales bacterium]|nr:asparagine synthase (glutamine-hydrolyzing) [Rhodospirillales bacterium]
MCGVAGIYATDNAPPDGAVLDRLEKALAHRGPDGRGRHQRAGVAMVHTRLAIIDLETGDQPFASGQAVLVANGEIYNDPELRGGLEGAAFATRSDCESALHLYLRHGIDFAERLRGMYAIAIHDGAHDGGRDRLVLARDPFGIKPLYYAETKLGFVFASEPQALFKAGLIDPQLRKGAANELLQLQFTCGAESAFQGVSRVLPGETLVVEGGRIIERRQRPALPQEGPQEWSEAEAFERLNQALVDSVTVHQRSDVPYGMFLSGGVDSSALLALMRDLNDAPVQAFTAGFPGSGAPDERGHAEAVAKAAGARFEAVAFTEDDFWTLLPQIAAAMDDPAADYALLPTYKLARLAAERGLKVILTGEGGDELFGGYGRYRRAMRAKLLGGRPMRASGAFDGLGVLRDETDAWRNGVAAAEKAEDLAGRSRLQVCQAVDCADWLPHDLLAKLDRCLMAHGVEGRVPFLDASVAEIAFRLPDKLKIKGGAGKWLLRKWLEDKLPEAQPFSKKRGFTVPVAGWIAAKGQDLGPLVAKQPCVQALCRPGAVETLIADPGAKAGKAAWNLLFYALWHKIHIDNAPAGANVFETLSS